MEGQGTEIGHVVDGDLGCHVLDKLPVQKRVKRSDHGHPYESARRVLEEQSVGQYLAVLSAVQLLDREVRNIALPACAMVQRRIRHLRTEQNK